MKNLKIYKSALALLTATSLLLLCGCNGKKNEKGTESCSHLTVYFDDNPVTFKECEGYEIDYRFSEGRLIYEIQKDDTRILDGSTNEFNKYEVYHNETDALIDEESVQKSR